MWNVLVRMVYSKYPGIKKAKKMRVKKLITMKQNAYNKETKKKHSFSLWVHIHVITQFL